MDCGPAIIMSTGLACSTALIIAGKPDFHIIGALVVSFAAAGFYYGISRIKTRW